VPKLIKSPYADDIFICSRCARIANTLSSRNDDINKKSALEIRQNWTQAKKMEVLQKKPKLEKTNFDMTPSQIHLELDKYIIGQEHAKKVLSVALYNHYKRLNDKENLIQKSNIILSGPPASGKTLLAKCISRLLNLPFVVLDITTVTESGYVGQNIESCLEQLLQIAGDITLAEQGIIFIDEIDKIARAGGKRSDTNDVSREGVQFSMLKLVEGSEVPIHSGRKSHDEEKIMFDTSNVLFICGGAFEGLFDNSSQNKPIGFQTTENNISNDNPSELSPDALIKYGLMPELIGRFPILCSLDPLRPNDLVRILTKPKNAITKEYQQLFAQDGIELEFTDGALEKIAQEAIKKETGARALRSILEDIMLDIMYDIPDKKNSISKCIITEDSVATKQPKIIKKRQQKKKAAIAVSS